MNYIYIAHLFLLKIHLKASIKFKCQMEHQGKSWKSLTKLEWTQDRRWKNPSFYTCFPEFLESRIILIPKPAIPGSMGFLKHEEEVIQTDKG